MEEQENLAKLRERLDDYINVLSVLDGVRGDPLVGQKYATLTNLMREVQNAFAALDTTVAKSKQLCETMRAQSLHFNRLIARMKDKISNRNFQVSTPLPNGSGQGWISPSSVSTVEQFVTPYSGHDRHHRLTVPNFRNRVVSPVEQLAFQLPPTSGNPASVSIMENGATPKPRRDMEIAISYISRAEFEAIPQYMRGRVRFDEIGAFIGVFNAVLNKKYALINKPKRSVKAKNEVDLLLEWKEQAHPDLNDQYFISEKDFTSLNRQKLSLKDRNIITMLRHVQRLKQISIKKVCYYIACF